MRKVTAAAAIVLAVGMTVASVRAQGPLPKAAADALRAANNEIFVQLASTPVEIHGRLSTFDATALTMQVDGRSFTFPSDEVLRVETLGGTNRRGGIRGAIIGGLVGGAWCALICGQALDGADSVAVAALGNAGLGAAIGGLIGLSRDGHKAIYQSPGPGAAISRRPAELPCPATPLALEADLSAIDLRRISKTWTPLPEAQAFGEARCDGLAIQRRYSEKKGTWQPGVEIAAGVVNERWIDVRVSITVRNPADGIDTRAVVDVGLSQNRRSQVAVNFSFAAPADEESSGYAVLRVPRTLLTTPPTGLSLLVTLRTSYPH